MGIETAIGVQMRDRDGLDGARNQCVGGLKQKKT